MGMTLVEAAKLNPGDVIRNAVIQMYSGSSSILENLPFNDIAGNALAYNREASYPGVGFRGVNEAYTASTGILNPQREALVIAGGELDVDSFIVQTQGANVRAVHEGMKIRALSLAWTQKFLKGSNLSDPREFDGLQTRITGSQLIAAGATANGTPLSLAVMDQAIDQTLNPTHLIMSKSMARKFSAAARLYTVGGYVNYPLNALGQRVESYNGLPILTVDLDNTGSAILPFTEACTSGTATGSSIYVVSFGDGMLTGIQNGGINAIDLGIIQSAPVYRMRVEWYNGIAIYHGRAATRLWSISDAAIVA